MPLSLQSALSATKQEEMHLLGMRQHPQVRGDVSEQPLFEWDPATQSVALRKSFPILCLAGRPNAGGWHFSDSSASPHWVGAMPLCRPSMAPSQETGTGTLLVIQLHHDKNKWESIFAQNWPTIFLPTPTPRAFIFPGPLSICVHRYKQDCGKSPMSFWTAISRKGLGSEMSEW